MEILFPFLKEMQIKNQIVRQRIERILSLFILLAGLLLMLYPWISNYVYEHGVSSTVNVYENQVESAAQIRIRNLLDSAELYNSELSQSQVMLTDPFIEERKENENFRYEEQLDIDGSGIMCFVDIPKIDVYLPVYHGTSNEVLEKGIGHIEGSSLPVGGIGTHAVLSGHTGINSAKLFTDLEEMEDDDLFFIHVLGETLAYRVFGTQVIEPEDTSRLVIEEGRDLVSLLTCTPYGVNTHRLVVTGERTTYTPEIQEEAEKENGNRHSQWMEAYKKAILMGLAAVACIILFAQIVQWLVRK